MTTKAKLPDYLYHALAFLWLYSGVVPVLFNHQASLQLVLQMGFGVQMAWLLLIGASVLDVLFAVLCVSQFRQSSWLWGVQALTVLVYNLLILLLLPKEILIEQLLHPFAPIIKNIPILAVLAVLYQAHRINHKP